VAPGLCGCLVPDDDSDGDGVLDCDDVCPGVPDIDSDGDAMVDCVDPCPYTFGDDGGTGQCLFGYDPSNFDPGMIDFTDAPHAQIECDLQIDTTDPDGNLGEGVVSMSPWCGPSDKPAFVTQPQDAGPELVIMVVSSLVLTQGHKLRVIGNRPLIVAAAGDITIHGTVSTRALGTSPGAGGHVSCSGGTGDNGSVATSTSTGGGGGGGGAFGEIGGDGGDGYALLNPPLGGDGGDPESDETVMPLRGGCRGGHGGRGVGSAGGGFDAVGGLAGAGGGAVQLSAAGKLTLSGTAVVSASGGGGLKGVDPRDGGGGGGSGGALVLEGGVFDSATGAWATANGGGGAAGNADNAANGNPGTDGFGASGVRAPGGNGVGTGGNGGLGGAQSGKATNGANGTAALVVGGGAGGGGGGGVGRIRLRGE
jgi:hypothetical protein